MRYLITILVLIVFASCNRESKKTEKTDTSKLVVAQNTAQFDTKLDSIRKHINSMDKSGGKSVTYIFSLEELLSLEGNEVKAFYVNGKLYKIEMEVFGETGKASFNYLFKDDIINVMERRYSSNGMLTDVKSDADIKVSEENNYKIYFNGKRMENSNTTDSMYLAIMKNVPTKL